MITRIVSPLILAGAAAAAIALAPTASATTSADCEDSGAVSMCTRTGHASIYASPNGGSPSRLSVGSGGVNPFGSGPMPPVLAMD